MLGLIYSSLKCLCTKKERRERKSSQWHCLGQVICLLISNVLCQLCSPFSLSPLSIESHNYLTTAPSNLSGEATVQRLEDLLHRPENVSVILVNWYPPAVRVQWMYNRTHKKQPKPNAFQIIYRPVTSR